MTNLRAEKWSRGRWTERLKHARSLVPSVPSIVVEGRLTRMVGLTLEATGCPTTVGGSCQIIGTGTRAIDAEVVGFAGHKTFLMPIGDVHGLAPNARVVPIGQVIEARVGDALLGRVVDGSGLPIDGRGHLSCPRRLPLSGRYTNPLSRQLVRNSLDVGVRAINGLCTVGRGQRIGLFASSGIGKSILLGMMTRFTEADVVVVGLIGERGREIREFTESILGRAGLARAVVVAAPANDAPLKRVHGAMLATTIAEYFCSQGRNVLLLLDSLTRFAQAQREIGLAIGEPPTTKGYPPSVFANLPRLVERAGNVGSRGGSITAFYTVLTEEDHAQDPIAEAARAILDGHIVLSRALADRGHYPAIDVDSSISRTMRDICPPDHIELARRFRALHASYNLNSDLINIGAYAAGSDPNIDEAIVYHPRLMQYLQQGVDESVSLSQSRSALADILSRTGRAES